jgi:hypothetical protein
VATKAKISKSTKSRVSKQAKKTTNRKLFIAFSVLLIVIVAVVGIVYYRSSQAALFPDAIYEDTVVHGGGVDRWLGKTCMKLQNSGRWCNVGRDSLIRGALMWGRDDDGRCATIVSKNAPKPSKWDNGAEHDYFPSGTPVVVYEYYYGKKACEVKSRWFFGIF